MSEQKKEAHADESGVAATPTREQRRSDAQHLLQVLREFRAEINDLSALIAEIKNGRTSVQANAAYIEKTLADVELLNTEVEQLNQHRRSDTIRHIHNCWEQMRASPVLTKPAQALPPQEQLHELTLLQSQASRIVLAVGQLTIPHRLNRWLSKARPGYYLPFHLLFEDELPSEADRNRVLNAIAWAPDAVESGVVDTNSGLIYRYESKLSHRIRSFLLVLLLFLFATLLVAHADRYVGVLGLKAPQGDSAVRILFTSWMALIAGIVVHMVVSRFKRDKQSGLPPVIAINDWLIHLSAHKGEIIGKLAFAFIGLFGLAFTLGLDKTTATSAFLVGYSLDSFVGLFGSSMEQRATAQFSALKKQLGEKGR